MATATADPTPTEVAKQERERQQAGLKLAGLSTELSGYDVHQLARASEIVEEIQAGGASPSERQARERIMGKPARSKPSKASPARGAKSMRQATEEVLKRAKGPLHLDEIAKRVLADPDVKTSGQTPRATIGAQLAVGAKAGRYVRTAPSTFTLPGKGGKRGAK